MRPSFYSGPVHHFCYELRRILYMARLPRARTPFARMRGDGSAVVAYGTASA